MGAANTLSSDDGRPSRLLAGVPIDTAATIVLVSGGFDPIHDGHVALLQGAATYGVLYVALNSDAWLINKKGYRFQSWAARAAVLRECRSVRAVMQVSDCDGTVCHALRALRPTYFANGGDRNTPNLAESRVCVELGIRQLFGVGGSMKINSSSELVSASRGHHTNPL